MLTVSAVAEAIISGVRTTPKNTILLSATTLKPVPLMVTNVPTGSLKGAKQFIFG